MCVCVCFVFCFFVKSIVLTIDFWHGFHAASLQISGIIKIPFSHLYSGVVHMCVKVFCKGMSGRVYSCFHSGLRKWMIAHQPKESSWMQIKHRQEMKQGLGRMQEGGKRERGVEEQRNPGFAVVAAEIKRATKGGSTETVIPHRAASACRAEASWRPPVSPAKNKPERKGEDSFPLSIRIFLSFVLPSFSLLSVLLETDDHKNIWLISIICW